jgi:hypothetical protein
MHPPEQAVHPLKPFSIKTQYLFQKKDLAIAKSFFNDVFRSRGT